MFFFWFGYCSMFDILTSFTEVNRFKFLNKTIKIQAMIQKKQYKYISKCNNVYKKVSKIKPT